MITFCIIFACNLQSVFWYKLLVTVKASNLEPHGNFGLFFFRRACYYQNAFYRKMINERNKGCRRTFDLQSRFCSFVAQNSPKEATTDYLLLDSAPNFGPLISRWKINKFENCWFPKCQDVWGSKGFVSAIVEFVKFPTSYEWSNIRRPVQ